MFLKKDFKIRRLNFMLQNTLGRILKAFAFRMSTDYFVLTNNNNKYINMYRKAAKQSFTSTSASKSLNKQNAVGVINKTINS